MPEVHFHIFYLIGEKMLIIEKVIMQKKNLAVIFSLMQFMNLTIYYGYSVMVKLKIFIQPTLKT